MARAQTSPCFALPVPALKSSAFTQRVPSRCILLSQRPASSSSLRLRRAQIRASVDPVDAIASLPARRATVHRTTGETVVDVTLNLDGTGVCNVDTGIPFLDHMLSQISSHGLVDLDVKAKGDLWIDDHHTNEDVGITIGMAIAQALGDKKGITRFGHFVAPLDEALVEVVMDFSGRPFLDYGLDIPTQRVGTYDTQLVREFYAAVSGNAQMTLHVIQRTGINSHHIIEASFKAFARAMRMALAYDPRRLNSIPSSKGVLTDATALAGQSTPNKISK